MNSNRFVSTVLPFVKPGCYFDMSLWTWGYIFINITFSKILFATGIFVIGRYSVMLFVFIFFGIGVTDDIVHVWGR